MRTSILSKVIFSFLIVIMLLFNVVSMYGQNDPSREIMVYFSKGVYQTNKSQPVRISSVAIQHILARFKINQNQVYRAFPNFNEKDTLKSTPEGRFIKLANMTKIFKIHIPKGVKRQEVIDSLKIIPGVLFAELNGIAVPQIVPNDTFFPYQWALQPGGGTGKIEAPEAWDIYTGSSNSIIGIIDWGVDGTHPDLSGKVSGDAPIDDYHGTHVAGIAAANTNNTIGVVGVDWKAQLFSKNIGQSDDAGIYQKIVDAVNYSSNVNVLNNSWALVTPYDKRPRYSTTVRLAFTYVYKMNRTAVCANGNFQQLYPNQTYYPAGFGQGIIAVGATDIYDQIANSSQVNNDIDVSAPGVSILSTFRNGVTFFDPNYEYLSGTSMSAPSVTGIVSLLKGYNPSLYNDDVEQIIRISTDDIGAPGWDSESGTGRVNARKALDYLRFPYSINHWQNTGGNIVSSTWDNYQTFYGLPDPDLQDGTYIVERHTIEKTIYFPQEFTQPPYVWGRGVATVGYSTEDPNFTMGYSEVVSGSITKTSVKLRTYIYDLYIEDPYDGWLDYQGTVPAETQNVVFAYTALGKFGIGKFVHKNSKEKSKTSFELFSNYPNPFNPSTKIQYTLPKNTFVKLIIYDVLGNVVETLVNKVQPLGTYTVNFIANNIASGIYFYQLKTDSKIFTRKMILMK